MIVLDIHTNWEEIGDFVNTDNLEFFNHTRNDCFSKLRGMDLQNLIMAMSVKVLILLLSVFGMANMWMAVISDTGVTLLTVLNTLRILRKF